MKYSQTQPTTQEKKTVSGAEKVIMHNHMHLLDFFVTFWNIQVTQIVLKRMLFSQFVLKICF